MSKKRTPEERRTMLIAILEQKQFVSSSELCERLESSESTIRRDLELMENKGQIERVHGGAILSKHIFEEPSFMQSKDMNYEEKMRIAEAACSLIKANDVIFFNHGTTTELIAEKLAERTDLEKITVITSNIGIINTLIHTDVQLICLGGKFRRNSFSLAGSLTLSNLSHFNANKCFLGVDGINIRYGCTFSAESDAEVSKAMAGQTHGSIYIVADHTKFATVSAFNCIPVERVDAVITGCELNNEVSSNFEGKGLEIKTV